MLPGHNKRVSTYSANTTKIMASFKSDTPDDSTLWNNSNCTKPFPKWPDPYDDYLIQRDRIVYERLASFLDSEFPDMVPLSIFRMVQHTARDEDDIVRIKKRLLYMDTSSLVKQLEGLCVFYSFCHTLHACALVELRGYPVPIELDERVRRLNGISNPVCVDAYVLHMYRDNPEPGSYGFPMIPVARFAGTRVRVIMEKYSSSTTYDGYPMRVETITHDTKTGNVFAKYKYFPVPDDVDGPILHKGNFYRLDGSPCSVANIDGLVKSKSVFHQDSVITFDDTPPTTGDRVILRVKSPNEIIASNGDWSFTAQSTDGLRRVLRFDDITRDYNVCLKWFSATLGEDLKVNPASVEFAPDSDLLTSVAAILDSTI